MLETGAILVAFSDPGYPQRLKEILDPPIALFVRGTRLELLQSIPLGVVGTRRPTQYGTAATERLSADLAHAGLTIVSGMEPAFEDCSLVAGSFDGDLDLGADAISRRDQDGIGETGRLEIEKAAKAADLGVRARSRGSTHQRFDQFHHAVAGIDIDAGGRVARLFHGLTNWQIAPCPAGKVARRLLRRNRRVRKRAGAAI